MFDPQHVRQRHRRLPLGHLHQQILQALAGFRIDLLFARPRRLVFRAHGHAGLQGDRPWVQNQRQVRVAQHRRPRIQADRLQHRAQRLHHNLLRIGQPVHHQPEAPPVGVQNGYEVVPLRRHLVLFSRHQQPVKKHQRQQLAAQPV